MNPFRDMGLLKTIYGLQDDQLKSVAKVLGISDGSFDRKQLRKNIIASLEDFYIADKGYEILEYSDILRRWRRLVYQVIEKRKFRSENKKRKQQVLQELSELSGKSALDCPDRVESVVRDILLLLWEESTNAEKQKFRDVVRQELDTHNVKFTEQEVDKAVRDLLMSSAGSALPFVIPVISRILLGHMTKGFMAWAAVNLLGQKALAAAAFGLLSGPVGWSLALGSLGVGAVTSGLKYRSERRKLGFIQAILSVYSYSYQNRFNQRRRASEL